MNISCRSCGRYLIPVLHCNVCMESISWICNSCERLKDVTHHHTMVAQDAHKREDWHSEKGKKQKSSSVISYKSYLYSHIPCMWICAKSALTFCALLPCADLFPDMVPALAPRLADLMWHRLVPGLAWRGSFAPCSYTIISPANKLASIANMALLKIQ